MYLTDKAIRHAKPSDKSYRISDGDGLFLQIEPNGGQYWRFRYRFAGKEKMLAMGTFPEISLAEARDKRLAARKLVANGEDPGVKKKQDKRVAIYKTSNTFAAVAKEWFDKNKSSWVGQHGQRLWRRLELHMLPEIGNRPIADITALDLLDALSTVEKRGTTETAHRLLQTCSVIFRYAVLTARINYNPTPDLKGALSLPDLKGRGMRMTAALEPPKTRVVTPHERQRRSRKKHRAKYMKVKFGIKPLLATDIWHTNKSIN